MKAENASDSVFTRQEPLCHLRRELKRKKNEANDTAYIFHASHDQSVPSKPSIIGINYYRLKKVVLEDVAIIITIEPLSREILQKFASQRDIILWNFTNHYYIIVVSSIFTIF